MNPRTAILSVIAAAAALGAGEARAETLQSPVPSVRDMGVAGAGDIAGDGIDAAWSNPAALASLYEREAFISGAWAASETVLTDQGSVITRPGGASTPLGGAPVAEAVAGRPFASAGVGWRSSRRLLAGLTLASPYASYAAPPAGAWPRYQTTTFDLSGADLQASLAWKARRDLTLAIGADVTFARLHYAAALPNLTAGQADGGVDFEGSGWNLGWIVGLKWSPSPRFTVGASYRAALTRDVAGDLAVSGLTGALAPLNGAGRVPARITSPWVGSVGLQWRATPRLTLSANLTRTGWSRAQGLELASPFSLPGAALIARDTTTLAAGASFEVSPGVILRAGVSDTPRAFTANGAFADGRQFTYAAGVSYALGPAMDIDAALSWSDSGPEVIDQTLSAYAGAQFTDLRLRGQWQSRRAVFALAIRKRL